MIKKENKRLTITLSKKQVDWLEGSAKKLNMTTSRFVKFLIDKNISHLISRLPSQDLEYLIKIAKTKWLDFDDDQYS